MMSESDPGRRVARGCPPCGPGEGGARNVRATTSAAVGPGKGRWKSRSRRNTKMRTIKKYKVLFVFRHLCAFTENLK